jgi:hypothetical protein
MSATLLDDNEGTGMSPRHMIRALNREARKAVPAAALNLRGLILLLTSP